MRINARLDEATEQQLEYLIQATGQSVSQAVRESVAHYCAQVKARRRPSRLLALAISGQWRSGGSDTSTQVRSVVVEALQAKYPQHFGNEQAAVAPARKAPAKKASAKKAAAARPERRSA